MEQKKEGRENKVLKSGGKLGQVVGALKKKKGGEVLQSPYELWTKEIIDLLTTNIPHNWLVSMWWGALG